MISNGARPSFGDNKAFSERMKAAPNSDNIYGRMNEFDSFEAWQRAESLARRARELVLAGRLEAAGSSRTEAVELARQGEQSASPQDSIDSSSVLREIAEDMASAGEFETAREIAAAIKNERKRQNALRLIAEIAAGKKGSSAKRS